MNDLLRGCQSREQLALRNNSIVLIIVGKPFGNASQDGGSSQDEATRHQRCFLNGKHTSVTPAKRTNE